MVCVIRKVIMQKIKEAFGWECQKWGSNTKWGRKIIREGWNEEEREREKKESQRK